MGWYNWSNKTDLVDASVITFQLTVANTPSIFDRQVTESSICVILRVLLATSAMMLVKTDTKREETQSATKVAWRELSHRQNHTYVYLYIYIYVYIYTYIYISIHVIHLHVRMDGRTDGRMDGRTDRWTDGWMDNTKSLSHIYRFPWFPPVAQWINFRILSPRVNDGQVSFKGSLQLHIGSQWWSREPAVFSTWPAWPVYQNGKQRVWKNTSPGHRPLNASHVLLSKGSLC